MVYGLIPLETHEIPSEMASGKKQLFSCVITGVPMYGILSVRHLRSIHHFLESHWIGVCGKLQPSFYVEIALEIGQMACTVTKQLFSPLFVFGRGWYLWTSFQFWCQQIRIQEVTGPPIFSKHCHADWQQRLGHKGEAFRLLGLAYCQRVGESAVWVRWGSASVDRGGW